MKKSVLAICTLLVCAPLAANASMTFPGVPNIPIKKGISFNGFFRNHQPVKLLFAVAQPGPQVTESLWNAALCIKYLQRMHYRYKMHVVFYSGGVKVANMFSEKNSKWAPLLRKLHKEGVTFSVCHNAMVLFHLRTRDIYPYMRVIPAGILSIAEYEMRGYQPIFNPNSVSS